MGRRNQIPKFQVWEDHDSTTTVKSLASTVDQCDVIRYVVKVDPAVTGELFIEFTDDRSQNPDQLLWDNLDFSQPLLIDGSQNTEYFFTIREHSAQKMRLNFINNAGTGLINAWIVGVNIGA